MGKFTVNKLQRWNVQCSVINFIKNCYLLGAAYEMKQITVIDYAMELFLKSESNVGKSGLTV